MSAQGKNDVDQSLNEAIEKMSIVEKPLGDVKLNPKGDFQQVSDAVHSKTPECQQSEFRQSSEVVCSVPEPKLACKDENLPLSKVTDQDKCREVRKEGQQESAGIATEITSRAEAFRPSQVHVPESPVGKHGLNRHTAAMKESLTGTPNSSPSFSSSRASHGDMQHLLLWQDQLSSPAKQSHWQKVRDRVYGIAAFKQAARRGNRRKLALFASLVVVAGCIAVIPYEFLLKDDQQATRIVNLATYLFAIGSSCVTSGGSVVTDRKIPLTTLFGVVVSYYGFNQLSAVAFGLGLPLPLALVIKNGGILAQMVAGRLVTSSAYTYAQAAYACCATVGIIVTVFSSRPSSSQQSASGGGDGVAGLVGAGLMFAAIMSRAVGTSLTQKAFQAHGRHYDEVLFYQHLLGLPLLLLEGPAILAQLQAWRRAPLLWAYLAVLVGANVAVTKACGRLVGISSPVVLNVVLVLQRFISILASTLYFNAPPYPPALMWFGSVFVVVGCVGYVLAPGPPTSSKKSL